MLVGLPFLGDLAEGNACEPRRIPRVAWTLWVFWKSFEGYADGSCVAVSGCGVDQISRGWHLRFELVEVLGHYLLDMVGCPRCTSINEVMGKILGGKTYVEVNERYFSI